MRSEVGKTTSSATSLTCCNDLLWMFDYEIQDKSYSGWKQVAAEASLHHQGIVIPWLTTRLICTYMYIPFSEEAFG